MNIRSKKQRRRSKFKYAFVIVLLVMLGSMVFYGAAKAGKSKTTNNTSHQTATTTQTGSPSTTVTTVPPTTACSSNAQTQLIVVSISKRHMWACNDQTVSYDSAVITGMENLPADLTPTGTYHIYSKIMNTVLSGSDSTGSWHDPVSYWMPFLSNQYGVYGFHDATWRASNAFGNISPYSTDASHGCVEMPLVATKWLYGWAPIGTIVTIVS